MDQEAAGLAGNAGLFVLMAWLVRHTFTHTIPRLVDQFTISLREHRGEFLGELRTIRAEQRADMQLLMAKLDKLADSMRDRERRD